MRRRFVLGTLAGLVLSISPAFVSAQSITELQAQVASLFAQIAALQGSQSIQQTPSIFSAVSSSATSAAAATCPNITRTLARGMRGTDVMELQNFLIAKGILSIGNNSGYYGSLTESAVQQFQCANLQICSGSLAANGYGAVGVRTRMAITRMCGAATTTAAIPAVPQTVSAPTSPSSAVAQTAVSVPGTASTIFYVDNTCTIDGNGTAQGCATATGAAGAFKSLASMTAKAGGYAPGDQILLKRGLIFREILVIPSSGQAGKPIRVASYGEGARPVILGSDVKTVWQADSGSVYVTPIDWTPNIVFQADAPLSRAATRASMSEGSFFMDTAASKIYVWPRGNAMPSEGFEITRRPQNYYGLVMDGWTGNSWIEFDGLEVKNSNWMSYRIFGGKHVTIKNSAISNGFFNAIIAMGTGQGAAGDPDGFKVLDTTIRNHGFARTQGHDGAAAISVDGADGFTIERNVIDTNYGEGIESYNTANNGTISGNTVRNQQMSGAIYVNASFGRPTSNISVRNNTVTGGSEKAHTALTVAIEGTGSISNVTFADNTVSGYSWGGGLVVGSGAGTISGSTFENNAITSSLHGIEVIGATGLTFQNNSFKSNTVNLSSSGSALLVTEGGAVGNTFSGNSFSSTGSSHPIYWLGKYYTVAEWQALQNTQASAPVTPPATSATQVAPSSSCVYGSNSGAVRTLASTYALNSACVSACIATRDSVFGLSDSGVCTYMDVSGVSTQTTVSPIACIYSSNTGSIKYAPVTVSMTRDSCKVSCLDARTQYYGASDTGVCLYYGPTGMQEMIAVP